MNSTIVWQKGDPRKKKIQKILETQHGYIETAKLYRIGVNHRAVKTLVETGQIIKLKRGLYRSSDIPVEEEELLDLSMVCPKGVLCLFTALSIHGLTTYIPGEFSIAIHRDAHKVTLPASLPVKLFYFSDRQYTTGLKTIEISGHPVKIFDPEKTICDCARYRNKIGLDILQEALKTYMGRKSRNLQKLVQYSEVLKVKSVIKPYLEALV